MVSCPLNILLKGLLGHSLKRIATAGKKPKPQKDVSCTVNEVGGKNISIGALIEKMSGLDLVL
jgi:hypothetical protein